MRPRPLGWPRAWLRALLVPSTWTAAPLRLAARHAQQLLVRCPQKGMELGKGRGEVVRGENEDEWMGELTVGVAAAGVVRVQVHQSIFVRDEGAVGLWTEK